MKYDYDVVVIGGGAAGLTAAGMSASFGAKTALIEAEKLGGDCTWHGCVPSKALLKAAKTTHTIRESEKFGIKSEINEISMKDILARVNKIQNDVYKDADDPQIYRNMGVEVIEAKAEFSNKNKLKILTDNDEREIISKFFVICTGSSPIVPPINGLEEIDFFTNENIFNLDVVPDHLIVVGAGPIGIEMSQAFRRFGAQVSIIDFADRVA